MIKEKSRAQTTQWCMQCKQHKQLKQITYECKKKNFTWTRLRNSISTYTHYLWIEFIYRWYEHFIDGAVFVCVWWVVPIDCTVMCDNEENAYMLYKNTFTEWWRWRNALDKWTWSAWELKKKKRRMRHRWDTKKNHICSEWESERQRTTAITCEIFYKKKIHFQDFRWIFVDISLNFSSLFFSTNQRLIQEIIQVNGYVSYFIEFSIDIFRKCEFGTDRSSLWFHFDSVF